VSGPVRGVSRGGGTGVPRAVAATAGVTATATAAAAAIAPRVATAARAVTAPRAVPSPRRAKTSRASAAPRGGAIAWPLPPLVRRQRGARPAGSLPHRIGAFVVSLPDHPWLDRLLRGRAWIPLLGVLLAGIVATQVEILKLGASMGRAIEQTTTLTSENEQLRGSVATLGDDQRIERMASAMGMVLPPPGAVGYLTAGSSSDVSRALGNLHSPDPSAFVSLTPQVGDGALVTGQGTSTLPPPSGEPTVSTPSATSSTSGTSATGPGATGLGATDSGATQSSSAASGSGQGTATAPQAPASATQSPATGTQSPTDSSQGQTGTGQSQADTSQAATGGGATGSGATDSGGTDSSATTGQGSQATTSGAAAVQPAGSDQQSGGG
jgi:hypothetical protein